VVSKTRKTYVPGLAAAGKLDIPHVTHVGSSPTPVTDSPRPPGRRLCLAPTPRTTRRLSRRLPRAPRRTGDTRDRRDPRLRCQERRRHRPVQPGAAARLTGRAAPRPTSSLGIHDRLRRRHP
jgi:hypothetical protein